MSDDASNECRACGYIHGEECEQIGYDNGYARAIADVAAWLTKKTCEAEGHDDRWCAVCRHEEDLADALDSGAWKEQR